MKPHDAQIAHLNRLAIQLNVPTPTVRTKEEASLAIVRLQGMRR